MKIKYLKKLSFFLITLALFLTTMASFVHAESSILYLTASVGETYETVGISYHCTTDDSYVIYGTDVNGTTIVNPKTVNPDQNLWHMDQVGDDTKSGFAERYVCKATLTNLKSNTKYYYQVVAGQTKSAIQSFTSNPNNDKFQKSFLFLTDIQSSGGSFQNPENLLKAILRENTNNSPNLIVMTGDQVDRGGYEEQWLDYDKYVTSLDGLLQATVPGNHEYYFSSAAGYISNEIYNQFYNNPLNGPSDRLGSSYYFKYDNVLFIMLDVVKTDYNVSLQQEWFRNVVANNPSQWIIVGSHPGVYATGAYASDATIMRRNWLEVFEECQVDLALNGHEHVYARKNTRYNGSTGSATAGEVNPDLGVTYLQGGAAGLKQYGTSISPSLEKDFDHVDTLNNTGCLITLRDDNLIVKHYKVTGEVTDEFTLTAKRPSTIPTISDEKILDSFKVDYTTEGNRATVSWSGDLYGNVKSLTITSNGLYGEYNIPIVSSKLNYQSWAGFFPTDNYDFTIKVNKKDGTTLTTTRRLILNPDICDYNIIYELDGGTNDPNAPTSFNGSQLPLKLADFIPTPTRDGYVFTGWKLNGSRKAVEEIPAETYQDITLTATWKVAPYKITYELDGGTNNPFNPTEYYSNNLPIYLASATKDGAKFLGWSLNGEIITSIPENTTGDIVITALWEQKGSNCSCKKNYIGELIFTISMFAGALIIFRKKH